MFKSVLNYFQKSFERKKARRVVQEYEPRIDRFRLKDGEIEFANWKNPLVEQIVITQGMVDFFGKFIQPGDLVVDIGANIGDTTVPMALAAGKSGTTLGFDPNPFVFKILKINAKLNETKHNIVPLPYAISVNEEEFYYVSEEASFGNGAISPTKEAGRFKFTYPEKIKGINLKKFLEENYPAQIDKLSFIKIDTEGYDKEIIKSIPDLIEKYKPVIVAESYGKSSAEDKTDLFNCISKLGYDLFYFKDFDVNTSSAEIRDSTDLISYKKTINFCAMPKGRKF
ncbi:FkbM family methyltransferase [Pollutibacter soli]|uniref:FkbM family methyltransferase n=1 Tax=Pollutibacter soli TaxID=3034157 RepID=UPI0030139C1C